MKGIASTLFQYFEMPIGAKADLSELLYISALMQTDISIDEAKGRMDLRQDGSITVEDLRLYLLSRHGLEISYDDLKKLMIQDVHVHAHDDRLDLVQLVALLFITNLCKDYMKLKESSPLSVDQGNNQGDTGVGVASDLSIVKDVLRMILHDVLGKEFDLNDTDDGDFGVPLTKGLIRDILTKYGERGMAEDDLLIDEMMKAAKMVVPSIDNDNNSGSSAASDDIVILNLETFLHLLTIDCREKIDLSSELKYSTNFTDVFDNCACGKGDEIVTYLHHSLKQQQHVADALVAEVGTISNDSTSFTYKLLETSQSVDYFAGTYACKFCVYFPWMAFYFMYIGLINQLIQVIQEVLHPSCDLSYEPLSSWEENNFEFGCDIIFSVIDWFVIIVLVGLGGCIFIYITGMGYDIENSDWGAQITSTLILTSIFILFFTLHGFTTDNDVVMSSQVLFLIFLFLILSLRWMKIGILLYEKCLKRINIPSTIQERLKSDPSVVQERSLKISGSKKITALQHHAFSIHSTLDENSVIKAYFGQGLYNFLRFKDETELVGGLKWGRQFLMKTNETYGIWISAKLEAAFISQMFIGIFIILGGIRLAQYTHDVWEPSETVAKDIADQLVALFNDLASIDIVRNAAESSVAVAVDVVSSVLEIFDGADLMQFDCLAISTYLVNKCTVGITSGSRDFTCSVFSGTVDDICATLEPLYRPMSYEAEKRMLAVSSIFNATTVYDKLHAIVDDAVHDNVYNIIGNWYPDERYMVWVPVAICTVISSIAAFLLHVSGTPNTAVTILKLRSGVIPTLLAPESFVKYRYYPINIAKIMSCIFWGTLVGSIVIGAIFGFLVFLALWQVTTFYMQRLIAFLVGMCLVIVIRWLFIVQPGRSYAWQAFYRTRPFASNWLNVLNECVALVLMLYTAFARLITLFLLSTLYIGRVDTPFIDERNQFVTQYCDSYHQLFVAGLITVEAHRHPYIETLGTMLLFKIRHGSDFINRVGCSWRLVFILTLMPWLQKYRILTLESTGNVEAAKQLKDCPIGQFMDALKRRQKSKKSAYDDSTKTLLDHNIVDEDKGLYSNSK